MIKSPEPCMAGFMSKTVSQEKSKQVRKILVVTPYFCPYWEYGGSVRSIDGIVRQFLAQDEQVTVLTTVSVSSKEKKLTAEYPGEFSVEYFPATKRFRFSLRFLLRCKSEVYNSDLIYVNGLWTWPSLTSVFWGWLFAKKLVLAPRGMLLKPALAYKSTLKAVLLPVYSLFSNNSRTTIHWTTNLEKSLSRIEFSRSKHVILPNYIYEMSFWQDIVPQRNMDGLSILYLGRLNPIKNIDLIIKAASKLADDGEKIELSIVGDGGQKYLAYLKDLASNSSPTLEVRFFGEVVDMERIGLIDSCHVGVLVSESENYGIAAAEIMARGRPVIISEGVALREFIEDLEPTWVVKADETQLLTALRLVLSDCKQGMLRQKYSRVRRVAETLFKPDASNKIFQ